MAKVARPHRPQDGKPAARAALTSGKASPQSKRKAGSSKPVAKTIALQAVSPKHAAADLARSKAGPRKGGAAKQPPKLAVSADATKPVPQLAKPPNIDGNLKDFPATLILKAVAEDHATASFTARVGYKKDTLYVGVEVTDDFVVPQDRLRVMLHFPGAGTTAPGYTFAFNGAGQQDDPDTAPAYAREAIRASIQGRDKGFILEAALPPQALRTSRGTRQRSGSRSVPG